MIPFRIAWVVTVAILSGAPLRAQDTLQLGALQAAALRHDPRGAQRDLLRQQSSLRESSLDTERRPQLSLNGVASHQSDVTAVTLNLPGASVPAPPKDRWQGTVDAQQLLYDGGAISARRDLERARLAESSAQLDAALYRLRAEVNAAFFSAYLLGARARELDALLADLDTRLQVARARVLAGAALPRDTSAIVAEQLRSSLAREEASAARSASLAVLARLTGRAVGEGAVLLLPDLAADVARTRDRGSPESLRLRPEFTQFERTRARLDREAATAHLENRPRLVAFGQAGLGRPGLNQFRTDPDEFWQAGIRVEWRPWTWRSADRSAQVIHAQQRIVSTEEQALAEQLARAVESDVADMARLRSALVTDERIVTLRSAIERQALAQFTESAISAAEYVEVRTDVLEARLTLERHRAELAQAQVRYLTTLGAVSPASGGTTP